MIVDSHCHLDDISFNKDRTEVIARAREVGVKKLLSIGTGNGPPDLEVALRLAEIFPEVHATVGIHPHHAHKASPDIFDSLVKLCAHHQVLALGEIGLDYYYDNSPRHLQRTAFVSQMEIARSAKKPIVIHTREAWDDTLDLLEAHWQSSGLGGIMHCFSGDAHQAQRCLNAGFLISFGGILTFNRSDDLRRTAAKLPLDRLLVETDAPYLTPSPLRKIRRNEPCFIVQSVRQLAETLGVTSDVVAETTTRNFLDLFNLNEQK